MREIKTPRQVAATRAPSTFLDARHFRLFRCFFFFSFFLLFFRRKKNLASFRQRREFVLKFEKTSAISNPERRLFINKKNNFNHTLRSLKTNFICAFIALTDFVKSSVFTDALFLFEAGRRGLAMLLSCAGCEKPIMDQYLLNVLDRAWHVECVRCFDCRTTLQDKCFSREAKLFCREDFFRYLHAYCLFSLDTRRLCALTRGFEHDR